MSGATMRPSAPDACDAPRAAEVPTVPAPGPCQRAALRAALDRHEAALWDIARLQAGMPAGEFSAELEGWRADRVRLRALRTAD